MVGAPIAHGGQATVHHAHHVSLGRAAAIKIFHPHVWADDGFRTRFRRECEALVALEHPNVIPVLDAGESDGVGWIVMHLATGGSLDDRLREGMLDPEEAVRILRQVASALDAAHEAGRLHRDVKPANVLLEPDGHAWLADFGVARPVGGTTTIPGQMVGTAAYMAPEVISGGRPQASADIYGFACMAFEVLTGARPYPDVEVGTVLFAHMERAVPRARSVRGNLPVVMEQALAWGLAKDPRDRPRTATALVDALAAAAPGPGSTVPMPRITPAAGRRGRARGTLAVIAVGSIALVGSAAGLAWMQFGPTGASPPAPTARPLPRIPTPAGDMQGAATPVGTIPGVRASDLTATASLDGGVQAYAVEAGPGRSPDAVARAVAGDLAASGLRTTTVDLSSDGAALIAGATADFLHMGQVWVVAEVPSSAAGAADVVVVATGDNGAAVRWMDALSAARPAQVLAPG